MNAGGEKANHHHMWQHMYKGEKVSVGGVEGGDNDACFDAK